MAFDYSVWEIWGPLLYGGRLVMVADSVVRSPEELHALLVGERVGMFSQTPSAFDALQTADALYPEVGEQLGLQTVGLRWGGVRAGAAVGVDASPSGPAADGQHVRDHRDHGARLVPGDHRGPMWDGRCLRSGCRWPIWGSCA